MVFSRAEIWWNFGSKSGETRRWQVCHRWWFHGLWHRHRIEPFSEITIILEQGEWSIAKDIGPFFKRCNARHRQTFYDLVNVYVFDIRSSVFMGKNYSGNLHSIRNTGKDLTMKQSHSCVCICKKISSRTLIIPRSLDRNKVVLHCQRKIRRKMGSSRWIDDDQNSEKADTQFSKQRVRCLEERSKAKEMHVPMGIRNCFSHNFSCESAQFLRSSLRCARGIRYLSNKNGETRVGRTIWPIVRASNVIDNDTQTFDWNSCTRKFIAKVQRTSGKLPQQDRVKKICTDAGWSRTVLHDKAHRRVLTIYRTSGMSSVHFSTRWKINWPERLDSREHQNGTHVRSHNQLFAR